MNKIKESSYMQWAKLQSSGKFSLAPSGLENYSIKNLPVSINDLEINGNSIYGYEPLLQALAQRYKVDPSSIVLTIGTSLANHLAMASLLEPGDEILIEQPTYDPILAVAQYLGAKIKRFPRRFEDRYQINPDDIKKAITPQTKLIILTNLHNPTGTFTSQATLSEISEITYGKAYILVDEVYLESMFEKTPQSAFHLGPNFIITNSLTKVYGLSGLRCGWILANPELAKKMWLLNDLFGVMAPHPAELLSVIAIKNLDKVVEKAKNLLTKNHLIINQFLDNQQKLDTIRPEFGTVMFPRLNNGNVEKLCSLLKEKYDTVVVPGKFFESPNHFRIGLGINSEILSNGLSNLALALDEL